MRDAVDVRTIAAGRECDALVAECVMQWTPKGPHPLFGTPVYHHRVGRHGEGDSLLPPFSARMEDAARVLVAMERRGYDSSCGLTHDGAYCTFRSDRAQFLATVDPREVDGEDLTRALALAICRAALLAVAAEAPDAGAEP